MKTFTLVPTETVSAIICDCCKTSFTNSDMGWHEIQSIEFTAGYESIFGDGNTISIDLCQDCLKQTLGQWLRVSEQLPIAEEETIPPGLIDAFRQSVERACAAVDEAVRFIDGPNHQIEGVENAADQAKSIGSGSETVPVENLKGILHKPGLPTVTIDDMRLGSHDKRDPRHRKRYTLEELLRQAPDRFPLVEGWGDMAPVGREFGADSVRFTRVLQRTVAVFGNPLEAVQWLTAANPLFDGQPMQSVIDSEEGCKNVLDVLSDMENGKRP